MVRLLVEDVMLLKANKITMHVRFKGGTIRVLTVSLPQNACGSWPTPLHVVTEIDRLLAEYTNAEIATQLNQRGLRSGKGRQSPPHGRQSSARLSSQESL